MLEISDDAMEMLLARLEAATEGRLGLREAVSQAGLTLSFRASGAILSLETIQPTDKVAVSWVGRCS